MPDVVGADPGWDINPVGKSISFLGNEVVFNGRRYVVIDYNIQEIRSIGDFEATYAMNGERIGIKPRQLFITVNYADRQPTGFVTSEIFPISHTYMILNWNRWFLSAVPKGILCPKTLSAE